MLFIHAVRCKHGLPLVADDKGKAAKKKNLQVIATLIFFCKPIFIICNDDVAHHDSFTGELWIINVRRRSRRRCCSIPTVMQV